MAQGEDLDTGEGRSVTYCIVPRELADKLHEPLRKHFRDDPTVEVVVERRRRERRAGGERRVDAEATPQASAERRTVRAAAGRRIGERRGEQVATPQPALPRKARPFADRLAFVKRVEPAAQALEDADSERLVMEIQAGNPDPMATLYTRYFDRIFNYLHTIVRDHHEAEDLTQGVFVKLIERIGDYERRRDHRFRGWLFMIVRNDAISYLRKQGRVVPMEPEEIDRLREAGQDAEPEEGMMSALDWITDRDLSLFVDRLPLSQRQVLVLRFLLGFTADEAAETLGATPNQVRKLQQRATEFLRKRLKAIGRIPSREGDINPSYTRPRQAYVVRARRFMLD